MPGNNFSFQHRGHDDSNQPRLSNGQFTFSDSVTATSAASQGQQALEAVMPVHRNAPLEQRMYPSSIADIVKNMPMAIIQPCSRILKTLKQKFLTIVWE